MGEEEREGGVGEGAGSEGKERLKDLVKDLGVDGSGERGEEGEGVELGGSEGFVRGVRWRQEKWDLLEIVAFNGSFDRFLDGGLSLVLSLDLSMNLAGRCDMERALVRD